MRPTGQLLAVVAEEGMVDDPGQNRAVTNLGTPLAQMDQDLLGMYIRWNATTWRRPFATRRPQGAARRPALLRSAGRWYRATIRVAAGSSGPKHLDYTKWEETGHPHHSERSLPLFNPIADHEVLKNRVSTRYWKEIPVEDEKIRTIIEAAAYAPTCGNRQTWKLYVQESSPGVHQQRQQQGPAREGAGHRLHHHRQSPVSGNLGAREDAGIIGLQLSLATTALGLAGCLMYGGELRPGRISPRIQRSPHRFMYLMYLFGYAGERTLPEKRIRADGRNLRLVRALGQPEMRADGRSSRGSRHIAGSIHAFDPAGRTSAWRRDWSQGRDCWRPGYCIRKPITHSLLLLFFSTPATPPCWTLGSACGFKAEAVCVSFFYSMAFALRPSCWAGRVHRHAGRRSSRIA